MTLIALLDNTFPVNWHGHFFALIRNEIRAIEIIAIIKTGIDMPRIIGIFEFSGTDSRETEDDKQLHDSFTGLLVFNPANTVPISWKSVLITPRTSCLPISCCKISCRRGTDWNRAFELRPMEVFCCPTHHTWCSRISKTYETKEEKKQFCLHQQFSAREQWNTRVLNTLPRRLFLNGNFAFYS